MLRPPDQKEKVEPSGNSIRPNDSETSKDPEIAASMAQGVETVKHGVLKASDERCMLASLADGSFFAIGRGKNQKLYRRSYDQRGRVVGVPVDQSGIELVGAEYEVYAEPTIRMVYPVCRNGGGQ
jgi:hypothetical protein